MAKNSKVSLTVDILGNVTDLNDSLESDEYSYELDSS